MQRVKDFNATGVAPDGYLYAGDLNLIQDAAAALADLTQNLQVGTLAIGEPGLLLTRFGSGEARLSGAFRTDGILRGLGGLYAGQFTTSQRDAIAAGKCPYGLIILNLTSNQYEWNNGSDTARSWTPLGGVTAGSVTTQSLASSVPIIPVGGTIEWDYLSTSIPSWSVLPYGQALSRTGFPTLFSLAQAAGFPHGTGDGSNTFNIADKRGRVSVGKDDMGGGAANRITVAVSGVSGATLGAVCGAEGVSITTAQMPSHTHGVSDPSHGHGVSQSGHSHSYVNPGNDLGTGGAGGTSGPNRNDNTGSSNANIGIQGAFTGIGIQANGSGGVHLNVQPTIIVNKILRVQ